MFKRLTLDQPLYCLQDTRLTLEWPASIQYATLLKAIDVMLLLAISDFRLIAL